VHARQSRFLSVIALLSCFGGGGLGDFNSPLKLQRVKRTTYHSAFEN